MWKSYANTLYNILTGEGCQQANKVDTYSKQGQYFLFYLWLSYVSIVIRASQNTLCEKMKKGLPS